MDTFPKQYFQEETYDVKKHSLSSPLICAVFQQKNNSTHFVCPHDSFPEFHLLYLRAHSNLVEFDF